MALQEKQLSAVRTSKPKRLPIIFSRSESLELNKNFLGTNKLILLIMYGRGRRIMEILQLRLKELDFASQHP
jgi:integrase